MTNIDDAIAIAALALVTVLMIIVWVPAIILIGLADAYNQRRKKGRWSDG